MHARSIRLEALQDHVRQDLLNRSPSGVTPWRDGIGQQALHGIPRLAHPAPQLVRWVGMPWRALHGLLR
jgi:hypothetical protein